MQKNDSNGANPTRAQIDSPYQRNIGRNSYKNRYFDGKRSVKDEYTGKPIYYSDRGQSAGKDAGRHYTTATTANTDHIQPVDVLIQRYGGEISAEDLRRIANSDYNLAMTNEQLNKAKGNQTNIQYLHSQLQHGTPENLTTSANMIAAQISADVHVGIDVGATKIRNAVDAHISSDAIQQTSRMVGEKTVSAAHAGASTAMITLTVSGLNNLAYVASGKKDLDTALRDVASDTANSFVSGAGLSITQEIIREAAQKSGAEALKKVAAQELPIAELALAAMVAGSVTRYINGEISGEDCAVEILLNGAGSLAYQLGFAFGGPVGAVVASIVMTQMTNTILEYRQEKKIQKERVAEIDAVLSQAIFEISRQKDDLVSYAKAELKHWDDTISSGFDTILQSAVNQDITGITQGLNTILALFNSQVIYPTLEDFERDFYNPDAPPLVL